MNHTNNLYSQAQSQAQNATEANMASASQAVASASQAVEEAQTNSNDSLSVSLMKKDIQSANKLIGFDKAEAAALQKNDVPSLRQNANKVNSALNEANEQVNTTSDALVKAGNADSNARLDVEVAELAVNNAKDPTGLNNDYQITLPNGYDITTIDNTHKSVEYINKFTSNPEDMREKVTLGPNNPMSEEVATKLSIYAAQVFNSLRRHFGLPDFSVNKGIVQFAMWRSYQHELGNFPSQEDDEATWNTTAGGTWCLMDGRVTDIKKKTIHTNLDELKRDVYESIRLIVSGANDLDGTADVCHYLYDKNNPKDSLFGSFEGMQHVGSRVTLPLALGVAIDSNGYMEFDTTTVDPSSMIDYGYGMKGPAHEWDVNGRYAKLAKTVYTVPEAPHFTKADNATLATLSSKLLKAQNKQKSTWAEWGRVGLVLSNAKDHQKWLQQAYSQAVSVLNLAQKHQSSKALNNVQQQLVKDQKSLTASLDILDAMNHEAQGNNKYQEALKTLKNAQAKYNNLVHASQNLKVAQSQVKRATQLVATTKSRLQFAKSNLAAKQTLLNKANKALATAKTLLTQATDQVKSATDALTTAQNKLAAIKYHNGHSGSIIVDPGHHNSSASSSATSSASSSTSPATQPSSSATSSASSATQPAKSSASSSAVAPSSSAASSANSAASSANSATSSASSSAVAPSSSAASSANSATSSATSTTEPARSSASSSAVAPSSSAASSANSAASSASPTVAPSKNATSNATTATRSSTSNTSSINNAVMRPATKDTTANSVVAPAKNTAVAPSALIQAESTASVNNDSASTNGEFSEVTNSSTQELPQTGSDNGAALVGLGLIGVLMSMFSLRRRHN